MKKHKIIAVLLLLALCLPLASCVAEFPAATGEETATATVTGTETATAPVSTEVPDTRTPAQVLADYENDLKEVFACNYSKPSDVFNLIDKMKVSLETSSDSLDSLMHGKAEHYRPALREFLFEDITSNLVSLLEKEERYVVYNYVALIRFMALEPDYWAPIEGNGQTFATKEEFFNYLLSNPHLKEGPEKSDTMFMGSYSMIKRGEPIPLLWEVRGSKDGKAFLQSVFVVDGNYYEVANSTHYEDSLVRKWLNETFYFTSFSDAEKERIVETELVNGGPAGPNTRDRIFIAARSDLQPFFDFPVGDGAMAIRAYLIPRIVDRFGCETWYYMSRDLAFIDDDENRRGGWDFLQPIIPHMVIDITKL